MFLKPIKVRSQQHLKTSDKKQLLEQLYKTFPFLEKEVLFSTKEEILLLKIETGAKLLIPVYVVNDQPILFIYKDILIPTLHMLWKFTNTVLVFKTSIEVLKKLINGADLMLPGIVEPSAGNLPLFSKDTLACVTSKKLKVPVVVGITSISSADIIGSTKGKCVHTLHIVGDKLFNLKNRASNVPSPLEELSLLIKNCEAKSENTNIEKENVSKIINQFENETPCEAQASNSTLQDPVALSAENLSIADSNEMDDLLISTLCSAIKYSSNLTFPILTSKFFKTYMVPACPMNKSLDLRKSSFKKCGSFIKHMMHLGILKVEEPKRGIEYIVEINHEHPTIKDFYLDPSDRPKHEKSPETSLTPIITEAHSVTAAVVPIFAQFSFTKGSVIDNAEIRRLVIEYIKCHNLQDEHSNNFVNLNEDLKTVLKVTRCTIEEIIKNVYRQMSPCYKIVCGNSEIIHKGKLEPINISVAKRSGNKKVTLVDNLEMYGININELASICQHGVAASTSVIHPEHSKKGSQLLVQGNQVLFVHKLLTEKCHLPSRYVRGLEFAPKK